MRSRFIFLLKYAMFWLIFFLLSRVVFLVYNFILTSELPFVDIAMTFIKGVRMDLSMMGYVSCVAALFISFTFLIRNSIVKKILNTYTLFFIILFSLITVVDAELYRNWGYRMDKTILFYLQTPKEAIASTSIFVALLVITILVLLIFLFYRAYRKFIAKDIEKFDKTNWLSFPFFLFCTASFFLPIRGGVSIAPMNTGTVYFSNRTFANHAAVNVHWQFGESVGELRRTRQIVFMPQEKARRNFNLLFASESESDSFKSISKVEKPNVIILILESFSSRMIEPLGGMLDVTPNINRLVKKGVLFNHFFANGVHSAKGLVSILSGYPAQPVTTIIQSNNKTEKLPFLARKMNEKGYHSSFYYGGNINFANIRQYLINSRFEKLVYMDDFDPKYKNAKWGIHDHVVFKRFYDDCENDEKPFFKGFFTLSSHEPFDVPHKSQFNSSSEEQLFLNAAHYTDSCLGNFVDKAEKTSWWDSTIMFVVADHSGRHPNNINIGTRTKFEIPLLILGGALNIKDTVISHYCNQIDIPKMIGRLFNDDFEEFMFSKDEISEKQSFAFFAFNDGFGFFKDSTGFIYDNKSHKIVYKEESLDSTTVKFGKAFLQTLIEDYNSK